MDWAAIQKEYIQTNISTRALAEKYHVKRYLVERHCTAEKWVELRRKFVGKSWEKTIEKASDLVSEARAEAYTAAQEMIAELRVLVKNRGDLKPREITGALKDCVDILSLKSDLDIEEQRARIEKLRKEAQTETEQKTEITVRFEDME